MCGMFNRTWLTNWLQPGTWPPALIFTSRLDSVFGIECRHALNAQVIKTYSTVVFVDKPPVSRSVLLSSLGVEKYQTLVLEDNFFFFFWRLLSLVVWVWDILSASVQPAGACVLVGVFPLSAHYRLQDKSIGPRHTPNQYARMYNDQNRSPLFI